MCNHVCTLPPPCSLKGTIQPFVCTTERPARGTGVSTWWHSYEKQIWQNLVHLVSTTADPDIHFRFAKANKTVVFGDTSKLQLKTDQGQSLGAPLVSSPGTTTSKATVRLFMKHLSIKRQGRRHNRKSHLCHVCWGGEQKSLQAA